MESIDQIHPILGIKEADAAREYILSGGWLTEHKYTEEFEKQICSFVNVEYCSAVPNGTLGLILALQALGIGVGDKVAVPALTMIATANAVRFLGAEPVFVDVDLYGCMDIASLTESVDAVIYVSLNGNSSGIDKVVEHCKHGLPLIEDACQSFGSFYCDRALGTFGDIGVFSFSPHKIITTGQGGAIVTKYNTLNKEIELLKDFGRPSGGDFHPFFGINAKFTDLQAIIGMEQLKTIGERLKKKKQLYGWYNKHLPNFPLMFNHQNIPWFMCGYFKNRDLVQEKLRSAGIGTRKMYPVVPHQPCYGIDENFPMAQLLSANGLWLPSSLDLEETDVKRICEIINNNE